MTGPPRAFDPSWPGPNPRGSTLVSVPLIGSYGSFKLWTRKESLVKAGIGDLDRLADIDLIGAGTRPADRFAGLEFVEKIVDENAGVSGGGAVVATLARGAVDTGFSMRTAGLVG